MELINIKEVWSPVMGYEGLYEVSNFGNVRGLTRISKDKNGNNHLQKGKFLKQSKTNNGYLTVRLGRNGVLKPYYVHRLVATAFIANPHNLPEVNHKDENKENNLVTNLEWICHADNINYGTATNRGVETRKKAKETIGKIWKNKKTKKINATRGKDGKLIINQNSLVNYIAYLQDIDVVIVQSIFNTIEEVVFNQFSSIDPHENVSIKLLNGMDIEREYVHGKKYTKGMFRDVDCPSHIKAKAKVSKYFNKRLNDALDKKY